MTEHARDLAASLAMLRERVTRVDERLSAATADLDDATTAIYQALDATGADFEALWCGAAPLWRERRKGNYPAAQAKVRHNKSAQPAAKRVRLCAASRRCRPIMQTPTACAAQVIPAAV